MIQMQRSLQLLSASSSSSFFPARSSSALLLGPSSSSSSFMAQLQFRAVQNLQGLHFPCSSSLGATRNYTHCSHLKLRRAVRVSSSFVSFNHSNLVPHSLATSFHNNNNNDNGGVLGSYGCGFSAKRQFSQAPKAADNKIESVGGFTKYWKKRKPLATHSNNKEFDSRISASSKDVDAVTKSEQNVRDEELGASVSTSPAGNDSIKSRASGKKKKQSRSKKNKDQSSSTTALEQHADGKSSEGNSQEKTSVVSKIGKSPSRSSEKKLAGKSSKEVTAGSASIEQQSNKKNSNVNSIEAAKTETQQPQKMGKLKTLGQGKLKPMYPPIAKSVVVVESVTKAQVIQGYLGDMFEVLPSYGHVRDLAARSGSVRPNDDFSMVWEVPSAAWTHLKSIKVALNGAENLILASDPDREGEAIAWHIIEMLEQQHALCDDITVARVVFNEITETSIKSALQAPREIDVNLVHAYLARRALDYLIGFNISPLLWRKLPGCQSAGRVQSAALSLICERETEINEFKPQEYWTVAAELSVKEMGSCVNARLTHFGSKKLDQCSISTDAEAKDIENEINAAEFQVIASKKNKMRKNPPTPYITSTLQQDAANKLNFSATYTMKLAQKLYEGVQLSDGKAKGLITYLRTDGLHISDEAVQDIRALVSERYGPNFASGGARKYYKKVKNAQEAHEAIRPTEIRMLPSMLSEVLDEDSLKLYTLIWSRTVACQMEPVTIEQVQGDIGNADKSIILRSSSSRVEFPGYQAVYEDVEAGSVRHKENEAHDRQGSFGTINSLKPGDPLSLGEVELKQHFTQPPPRYSEGSLVKKLEELGIGRPSTYASTLKVLQDRDYVTVKSRVLYPEFRGRMVSAFLSHHFTEVTDYSFTADMENELDNVSAGLTDWKGLLRDYWTRFSSYCKRTESVNIHQVEKMLEKKFGDFLFGSLLDNNRTCPSCMEGTLIFKVSRYGAGYFIGCDQHPKCKYIAKTLYGDDEEEETPQNTIVEEPKLLGLHPASSEKIFLKKGPYGYYVQLGEDRKNYVPKRASVSNIKDVQAITVGDAIELLRYPVTLGNHPKDGHPVILKLAKVGFSIRHRRTIATVPKNLKPEDITMEKAVELLSGKDVRRCGRPKRQPRVEEAMEAI